MMIAETIQVLKTTSSLAAELSLANTSHLTSLSDTDVVVEVLGTNDLLISAFSLMVCVILASVLVYRPKETLREIKLQLIVTGKPKTVRFADEDSYAREDLCQYIPHNGTDYIQKYKKRLWWQPKDYRKFKRDASNASEKLIGHDHDDDHHYNRGKPSQQGLAYTNAMADMFQACCLARSEDIEGVVSLSERMDLGQTMGTGAGVYRIGLEKFSIPTIENGCYAIRQQVVQTVFEAQMKYKGDMEAIRKDYMRKSRPSRLFAVVMAKALAASCAQEFSERCDQQHRYPVQVCA